ncbi:MAG TPA: phosphoglucosamine mutase [Bacteroidales bacterium]|nr:phosphoglucosamine mutase [Bacteroidales bacterium]
MTLIKSISGIRGTIGGLPGESLTPIDVVRFTSAFAQQVKSDVNKNKYTVVIGRDARISGQMISSLVAGTLMGMGIHVIDLGYATTPTVELGVTWHRADGGIILTASHNPGQWNALKLLNEKGEFISAEQGAELLKLAVSDSIKYPEVEQIGHLVQFDEMNDIHIDAVLDMKHVDCESVKKAGFKVVIDCVNSVGGIILPELLKEFGVEVVKLYCEPTGKFPHNPEPLPQHLGDISAAVVKHHADVGFVVDPDVDRLVIINEDGTMFGEEYTLVAVSDYVLSIEPGNTVSNLSSTRALADVTARYGGSYSAAPVGEVNVVNEMKKTNAVIGGEGNGGVIYPALHYGRDALVGVGLFLTCLAKSGKKCSELRKSYPDYYNSKNKIELKPGTDVDKLINAVRKKYEQFPINDKDGIRIDFDREWVHLRKSNTEPIIRVISESITPQKADALASKMINEINELVN